MDTAQRQSSQFPNIFRLITERSLPERTIFYLKVTSVSFFSVILLMGIALQIVSLRQNIVEAEKTALQREEVVRELSYWKGMTDEYKGHRDIYYRIAALDYQLGEVDESKKYVKKALELDPNFEAGKVLGARVGAF